MNGLRHIREKHKMSIGALSEKLGVSRQAISIWERGLKPISSKRLEELSTIFDIPKEYFLEISELQKLEIEKIMLNREIIIMTRLTIMISEKDKEKIMELASEEKCSVSTIVNSLIKNHLTM